MNAKDFNYPFENDGLREGVFYDAPIAGVNINIPFEERLSSADWRPYAPAGEIQYGKQDYMDCVSRSYTNAIELQEKFYTGKEANYTERWLSYSVTTKQGAYLDDVDIRAQDIGLAPQSLWEDTGGTWEDQHTAPPSGKEQTLLQAGQEWKDNWQLDSAWVDLWSEGKHWLKMSPLQVIIPGHAIVIVHIDENNTAYYFDSYDPFIKTLPLNAFRQYAKLLAIKPKFSINNKRMIPTFQIKTDANKTMWVLSEGQWVGFAHWEAFQKYLNGRPYETIMLDQAEFDKLKVNPEVFRNN